MSVSEQRGSLLSDPYGGRNGEAIGAIGYQGISWKAEQD